MEIRRRDFNSALNYRANEPLLVVHEYLQQHSKCLSDSLGTLDLRLVPVITLAINHNQINGTINPRQMVNITSLRVSKFPQLFNLTHYTQETYEVPERTLLSD